MCWERKNNMKDTGDKAIAQAVIVPIMHIASGYAHLLSLLPSRLRMKV
jgi:hypothetical protein